MKIVTAKSRHGLIEDYLSPEPNLIKVHGKEYSIEEESGDKFPEIPLEYNPHLDAEIIRDIHTISSNSPSLSVGLPIRSRPLEKERPEVQLREAAQAAARAGIDADRIREIIDLAITSYVMDQ